MGQSARLRAAREHLNAAAAELHAAQSEARTPENERAALLVDDALELLDWVDRGLDVRGHPPSDWFDAAQ